MYSFIDDTILYSLFYIFLSQVSISFWSYITVYGRYKQMKRRRREAIRFIKFDIDQ